MKIVHLFLSLFGFAAAAAAAMLAPQNGEAGDESLVVSQARRLQEEGQVLDDPPYTPEEVQKMLYKYTCAFYRGRLSDAVKDADINEDGALDDEEANILLSKAVAYATGAEDFKDGVAGRVDIIIIIFIKKFFTIIIIIIIIVGECTRDPHVMTFGGKHLGFGGVCDLLLMKNPGFADGTGIEIQGRTAGTVRPDGSEGAILISAAVRIGSDVLEVTSDGTHYLNGNKNAPLAKSSYGGEKFSVYKEEGEYCFGPGLDERCAPAVMFDITTRVVEYTDVLISQHIYVTAHRGFVDVIVEFSDETLTGTSGLMGTYPWDGPNDKIARDGKTVMFDPSEYGLEWQVNPEAGDSKEMFLQARNPQYPEQCILPQAAVDGRRNLRQEIGSKV